MEELLQNFHFIRPWWLLALLLPLWGYYKFAKKQKLSSSWKKVCDKRLLEFLLIKTNSTQVRFFSFLVFLGFLSAILALAGPSWHKIEVPSFSPQNPVMLVLNVSSDMLQKDLTPDRLSRAKYKIDDMLKLLKNNQTGLIIFTQEPFLITPITDDYRLISNLLPEISTQIMPLNGERLDRALDLASDKLKNSEYEQKIILFAKIAFKVKLKENNINDENDRLFKDWFRVINNLIKNTTVGGADSFKNFILSTNELLSKLNNHNLDILECLRAIRGEDLKDLNGFNECQLKEEIVKAKLISRSDEWKVAITDAEKPENIDSKIAFILRLSNTIGYVNCDFKLKDNYENKLDEFKSYTTLVKALFEIIYNNKDKKFLWQHKDKKFLWQRYLLSCNIRYPYGIGTSENINLLLPSSDKRSFSWKRFFDFSRDKTYNDWKNLVKVYKRIKDLKKEVDEGKVLECLLKSGIKERLEVILKNPNELTDYDLFIIYPEAMKYCEEGYFRDEIDINKNIYIIRGRICVGTTSPSIRSYCGYIDVKRKETNDIPIIIKDHCAYRSYENEKSEYKWEKLDKEYLEGKIKELDS